MFCECELAMVHPCTILIPICINCCFFVFVLIAITLSPRYSIHFSPILKLETKLAQSIPFQRSSYIIKKSMNKYFKTITFPKISSSPKVNLIDYGEAILLCKRLHLRDIHQLSSNHIPLLNFWIFATPSLKQKNGLQEDLQKCLSKMISNFLTRWCLM